MTRRSPHSAPVLLSFFIALPLVLIAAAGPAAAQCAELPGGAVDPEALIFVGRDSHRRGELDGAEGEFRQAELETAFDRLLIAGDVELPETDEIVYG